jgi:hypothetical protein
LPLSLVGSKSFRFSAPFRGCAKVTAPNGQAD